MARISPFKVLNSIVLFGVVIIFLFIATRDTDTVIPRGSVVLRSISNFVVKDSSYDRTLRPEDIPEHDTVVFNSDQRAGYSYVPHCTPKQKDFIFVKTHKAGSTTIISILQRFGHRHNLTFALPVKGDVFLAWPYYLVPRVVLPLANKSMTYNILTNHAVYDRDIMHQLVPNNPKHLGIVREPLSQFKSTMNYFQKQLIPDGETFSSFQERVDKFVADPIKYDTAKNKMKNTTNPALHIKSVTRNLQSADFGLKFKDMEKPEKVADFLENIQQDFDFLLVMEYMHESLLLLKRMWCWELRDIFFLQKNVFKYAGKADPIEPGPAEFLRKHWVDTDVKLYNWANKTLWDFIAKEEDFHLELSYYKSINNLVGAYCSTYRILNLTFAKAKFKKPTLDIAASVYNEAMVIHPEDCDDLMRMEQAFTRLLQIEQRPDLFSKDYYLEINDGIRAPIKRNNTAKQ